MTKMIFKTTSTEISITIPLSKLILIRPIFVHQHDCDKSNKTKLKMCMALQEGSNILIIMKSNHKKRLLNKTMIIELTG
jgi:ubiquitin